jgi:putative ABC transport system permease protein
LRPRISGTTSAASLLTAVGIGLLLMIVLGMSGIYRGMIDDAMVVVDRVGADLWVVQRGHPRTVCGDFARARQCSSIACWRCRAWPAHGAFVSHNIQREHGGRPMRINVQGLAWPEDKGEWLTLAAGRPLGQAHYEMVADQSLGLALGEASRWARIPTPSSGSPRGWFPPAATGWPSSPCAMRRRFSSTYPARPSALERTARVRRGEAQDVGRAQPLLLERAAGRPPAFPRWGRRW